MTKDNAASVKSICIGGHRGGGDHLADSGDGDGVYRRADGGGYVG